MDDTNGIWSQVNDWLMQATSAGLTNEDASKLALSMVFGIDGPWTNNSYQHYELAWYNAITLEQIDGDITINKVDSETGELITTPATFNLYYYKVEIAEDGSENKVTYYYALDENGKGYCQRCQRGAGTRFNHRRTCFLRRSYKAAGCKGFL